MPRTTVSKTIYQTPSGEMQTQYRTTIPKGLAEALDLADQKIEWEVDSANTLLIRRVDE